MPLPDQTAIQAAVGAFAEMQRALHVGTTEPVTISTEQVIDNQSVVRWRAFIRVGSRVVVVSRRLHEDPVGALVELYTSVTSNAEKR